MQQDRSIPKDALEALCTLVLEVWRFNDEDEDDGIWGWEVSEVMYQCLEYLTKNSDLVEATNQVLRSKWADYDMKETARDIERALSPKSVDNVVHILKEHLLEMKIEQRMMFRSQERCSKSLESMKSDQEARLSRLEDEQKSFRQDVMSSFHAMQNSHRRLGTMLLWEASDDANKRKMTSLDILAES